MLARPYQFSDAKGLDRLIRHETITNPAADNIFVAGEGPAGVLVYRAGAFVHELEVGNGLRSRSCADALANYAIAHARTKEHVLRTAIFLIRAGNTPMMRFVESLGAVKQTDPGDVLYTLTPQ